MRGVYVSLLLSLISGFVKADEGMEARRFLKVGAPDSSFVPALTESAKFPASFPRKQLRLPSAMPDWDGRNGQKLTAVGIPPAGILPPPALRPWPTVPRSPESTRRIPEGFVRPTLELEPSPREIAEGQSLAEQIPSSIDILPEEKRVLMAEWALIVRDHDRLVEGQERIILKWSSSEVERKFEIFIEKYWAIADGNSRLQERFSNYQSYCSRQVSPEEYDAAVKECAGIKSAIDRDLQALQSESLANAALYNSGVRAVIIAINSDIEEQNQRYTVWLGSIREFNRRAETRVRPRDKPSHISIHVQPDGRQGRDSWIAGSTLRNPTRQSATTLLTSVQAQAMNNLGNRAANLSGFDAAMALQRRRLENHTQISGFRPWSAPFGDRLQFRLDLEIEGEYPARLGGAHE